MRRTIPAISLTLCVIFLFSTIIAYGQEDLEGFTMVQNGVWEKVDKDGVLHQYLEGIDGLDFRIRELDERLLEIRKRADQSGEIDVEVFEAIYSRRSRFLRIRAKMENDLPGKSCLVGGHGATANIDSLWYNTAEAVSFASGIGGWAFSGEVEAYAYIDDLSYSCGISSVVPFALDADESPGLNGKCSYAEARLSGKKEGCLDIWISRSALWENEPGDKLYCWTFDCEDTW